MLYQVNRQPIQKQVVDGDTLSVHSIFKTLQGEGPFVGSPSMFVRLSGCNLQCPACDTDYSSVSRHLEVGDIIGAVTMLYPDDYKRVPVRPLVVITGGEPFRQPIGPLVERLIEEGYHVQIETSGTLWQPGPWGSFRNVSIVCSPKTPKLNKDLEPWISSYKYVLDANHVDSLDGLPTLALLNGKHPPARPPLQISRRNVYVQPLDMKDTRANSLNTLAAVNSCLKFGYTMCLQTHKILGLE